jgi:uncharacterized membrane protein YfcA
LSERAPIRKRHPPSAERFLVGPLLSLAMLLVAGRIDDTQLLAAAQLLPALLAGALLSHLVHHRVHTRFLRAFVLVFALASAALLLMRAL